MAATPKRKTSKARRNNRRAHHHVSLPKLIVSKQTGKLVPVGIVSAENPSHKGIEVVKAKKTK
jgi:ribosomal protein L32